MEKQIFTNGEYFFTESEEENQFYFYRRDDGVLGNVGEIPMNMYQHYVLRKMFRGEITDFVATNLSCEISEDGKVLRLTALDLSEEKTNKENVSKRLFKSLFGNAE